MSSPVPIVPSSEPTQVKSPDSADATTAGALAQTHGEEKISANTGIRSLAQLKNKAPKVYHMMMVGIAMDICNQMEHQQDRLKKIMRQSERDAYG